MSGCKKVIGESFHECLRHFAARFDVAGEGGGLVESRDGFEAGFALLLLDLIYAAGQSVGTQDEFVAKVVEVTAERRARSCRAGQDEYKRQNASVFHNQVSNSVVALSGGVYSE